MAAPQRVASNGLLHQDLIVHFFILPGRFVKLGLLCLLVLDQAKAQGPPLPAGRSLGFDAALGYSYVRMTVPDSGKIGMSGPDATVTIDFLSRVGVRADVSYVRSGEVFGTGHHNDAISYMGGPVFYIVRERQATLYVQALLGEARLRGINFSQTGGFLSGYDNKPAWSLGAGGQHRLTSSLSLRVAAEYLHTTFFDPRLAFRGTGSLRASVGVVYTFGRGHAR